MAKKKESGSGYTRNGLEKLPESVVALADKIKAELKIGEGGVIPKPEKDFWKKLVGDNNPLANVTVDEIQRVDKFRTDLVAGASLAGGEVAVEGFYGDEKLQQVSLELNLNKDVLAVTVDRQKSFPNRMGGENAPDITRNCQIQARYTTNAVGNRGTYQQVRTHFAEQGAAIFG